MKFLILSSSSNIFLTLILWYFFTDFSNFKSHICNARYSFENNSIFCNAFCNLHSSTRLSLAFIEPNKKNKISQLSFSFEHFLSLNNCFGEPWLLEIFLILIGKLFCSTQLQLLMYLSWVDVLFLCIVYKELSAFFAFYCKIYNSTIHIPK